MRLLIDSSGPALVCALAEGDVVTAERRSGEGPGSDIAAAVDDLLRPSAPDRPDGIIVGIGPGSFIGTRTAISFANGYAAASGVPLFGVGSLDALAAVEPPGVAVLRDARRGQLYLRVPGGSVLLLAAQDAAAELVRLGVVAVVLEHVPGERGTQRATDELAPLLESAAVPFRLTRGVTGAGLLAAAEGAEACEYVEPVYLRGFT